MMDDRIFSSVPLNSTAARVTGKGVHYDPKINYGSSVHFKAPPPMKDINKLNPKGKKDALQIIGKRFGRFTVIGLADGTNPKKHAKWVVRCDCGDYEHRSYKAVNNPENTQDRCKNCRHLAYIKKSYKRNGARPLADFIGGGKKGAEHA
jgi:hypothetical protein